MYEYKAFPFECKIDMDANTFEGYFSISGNIDDGQDRVMQGAFTKTFQENRKRIKGLYMHEIKKPFSKPIEIYEDSKGAYVKGSISLCSWGQDLKILMADGVVDEMSFGYDAVKYDYERMGEDQIRNLREIKVWEYSPVTWGMNSGTSINNVKALDTLSNEIKESNLDILKRFELLSNIVSGNANSIKEIIDLSNFKNSKEVDMTIKEFNIQEFEKSLSDIKAGRTLSARNRTILEDAIKTISALLGNSEPSNDEVDSNVIDEPYNDTQKAEKSLECINPNDFQLILDEIAKYK